MRKLLTILAALMMIVGCSRPSKTVIKGTFTNPDKVSEKVRVWFADGTDTIIVVNPVSASFKLEMPTDLLAICSLSTGLWDKDGAPQELFFIPEGGTLSFEIASPEDVNITSSNKKHSPTRDFLEYDKAYNDLMDEYKYEYNYDSTNKINETAIRIAGRNRDNIVAPIVLTSAFLDNDQLYEELMKLDESVRKSPDVAEVISQIETILATVGGPFVDFTIIQDPNDPEGSKVSLSDYVGRGKYILVDFWASWCGPCKRAIPKVRAAWEKYGGDNFDVVSIAVSDRRENTLKAIEELNIEWNNIINAQQVPFGLYNFDTIPLLILFGPDGTILERDFSGSEIEAVLSKYLKEIPDQVGDEGDDGE